MTQNRKISPIANTNAAVDFMQRQVKAGKPFFVWMNTTRIHVFTHVRESMRGQSGMPGNE